MPAVAEPPKVPENERPVVTLPDAVRECVLNNLRLNAAVGRRVLTARRPTATPSWTQARQPTPPSDSPFSYTLPCRPRKEERPCPPCPG